MGYIASPSGSRFLTMNGRITGMRDRLKRRPMLPPKAVCPKRAMTLSQRYPCPGRPRTYRWSPLNKYQTPAHNVDHAARSVTRSQRSATHRTAAGGARSTPTCANADLPRFTTKSSAGEPCLCSCGSFRPCRRDAFAPVRAPPILEVRWPSVIQSDE